MYDFDKVVDRRGTSSIKWNFQEGFGQHDGLLPYWIADTDFATVPEVVQALQDFLRLWYRPQAPSHEPPFPEVKAG